MSLWVSGYYYGFVMLGLFIYLDTFFWPLGIYKRVERGAVHRFTDTILSLDNIMKIFQ